MDHGDYDCEYVCGYRQIWCIYFDCIEYVIVKCYTYEHNYNIYKYLCV